MKHRVSEMTKTHSDVFRFSATLFSIFSIFLGLAVIAGWYFNIPALMQINSEWVPMQFNTAFGFLIAGCGLYLACQKPGVLGSVLSAVVALLGTLTLWEYIGRTDLRIDEMFMKGYVTVKTSHPGRMAPNTALGFALIGTALVLANMKSFPLRKQWIPGIFGALVVALGGLALIGYGVSIEASYGWGNFTRMAIHSALGILGIGIGSLLLFYSNLQKFQATECCPPIFAGILGFLLTGGLWLALIAQEKEKALSEIEIRADNYVEIIKTRLNDQANALTRMARRWEGSTSTDPSVWRKDATNYITHFSAYHAIGWADSNHILQWAVPEERNREFQGLSLVLDQVVRPVLDQAISHKAFQVTGMLHWKSMKKITVGVIPLYAKGKFDGTLVAVFDISQFSELISSQEDFKDYPYALLENDIPLIGAVPRTQSGSYDSVEQTHVIQRLLKWNGLNWEFRVHVPEKVLRKNRSVYPELVLGVGIFLSFLVGLGFHLLRKSQLHRKNLEKEMDRRQKVEKELARAQKISKMGNWTLELPEMSMRWSEEGLRILGFRAGKGLGSIQEFLDKVHPEDRGQVESEIQKAARKGTVLQLTHRLLLQDGSVRTVKQGSEIYLDKSGKPVRILGTIQDITDQKEAENLAARLGRIVDKSFNEIYIFNAENLKFTQVNLGARLNLRYSMEELSEMTPVDLKPEYTLEKFEKAISPLKQGLESVVVFETVHQRKNGTLYPVEVRLQLSKSETPPQFVAIIQDITERKKAEELFSKAFLTLEKKVQQRTFDLAKLNRDLHIEVAERKNALEALEKSEKNLEAIMDNVVDGIVTIDEQGVIRSFNSSAEKLFGFNIEEVLGKNVNMLMPEPEKSEHSGYVNRFLKSGRSAIMGLRRVVKARKKDGTLFSAELAVSEAAVGDTRMFTGLVRDLTEKEEVERQLFQTRKSRDELLSRYHLILEAAGEGVYGLDVNGAVTFINPAAERMLGYSADELMGKTFHKMVHYCREDGSYYDIKDCPIYSAFKDGEIHHVSDEVFWNKYGTSFPVEYYSTPIKEGDNLVGAVVTFKDITARKKVEEDLVQAKDEAEKANKAKSQFLSQMSHELRTPLNAILGFSQLIDTNPKEPLTDSQQQGIGEILKAGRHLLDLINEILDMARIEAGNLSMSIEDINLNDLVEELITLTLPIAKQQGIELYNFISLEGDLYVRADRVRLKQVLLNLMSNSIKYNKPNGSVKLEAGENQDGLIEISVSDTGQGIPEDKLSELFQPFNRLGSENSEIEGTGIGLTITKQLMDCMEGSIRVESQQDEGSVFTLVLPRGDKELATEELFLGPVLKSSDASREKNRQTIIYVEDNPANLNLVRHLFRRRDDIELLAAPDAKLGIELAKAHKPDLILMDINLPGMDGIAAMKHLRLIPETQDIPVVAISANAMPRDIKKGLDSGFVDYLTKPLDVSEFHRVVSEVLQGKATQDSASL